MTDEEPESTTAPASVSAVVARILETADETARPRLGDIVQGLGQASFAPVLMAPALAVVSPLSGIPLFSSLCGIIIALVAAQMALGRRHLWLPQWLMRRSLSAEWLHRAARFLERPVAWLDRRTTRRLGFLVRPPLDRLVHLGCLLCGAAMPLLELVPFTASTLGAAVLVLSLSLLVRDGAVALLGLSVIGGAVALGLWAL